MRRAASSAGLLLLLAIPLFFVGLGAAGLSDPDEPYYAVPALEMLRSGIWQVTIFRGQPWFDKPILFYWMVLAAFKVLGVSELAARLGSALAGAAGVLAVLALGRRPGWGAGTGMASAVILATSLEYALMARSAVTDMTLTFFLTAGMLAMARYLEGGATRAAGLAGAAFGLAALTKGPVGFLLPGTALVAYAILARRSDLVRPRALAAAALGAAVAAGPWYAYMAFRHRDLLVGTFLGEGNLGRFMTPEHPAFPLYYAAVLAGGLLPWSGAMPAALLRAGRASLRAAERGPGLPPGPLFALSWFAAVIAIFSLSASKLPSYVLPAFPPAALLVGEYWARALTDRPSGAIGRGPRLSAWIGVALAAAGAAGLLAVSRRAAWSTALPGLAAAGAMLLAAAVAARASVLRGRLDALLASGATGAVGAVLLLVLLVTPRLEPYHSIRPLVRALERGGHGPERVVGAFHVSDVSLDFYLERNVPNVTDRADLARRASAVPEGIWIVRTRDLERLERDPDLYAVPVERGPYRSAVRFAGSTRPMEGT